MQDVQTVLRLTSEACAKKAEILEQRLKNLEDGYGTLELIMLVYTAIGHFKELPNELAMCLKEKSDV